MSAWASTRGNYAEAEPSEANLSLCCVRNDLQDLSPGEVDRQGVGRRSPALTRVSKAPCRKRWNPDKWDYIGLYISRRCEKHWQRWKGLSPFGGTGQVYVRQQHQSQRATKKACVLHMFYSWEQHGVNASYNLEVTKRGPQQLAGDSWWFSDKNLSLGAAKRQVQVTCSGSIGENAVPKWQRTVLAIASYFLITNGCNGLLVCCFCLCSNQGIIYMVSLEQMGPKRNFECNASLVFIAACTEQLLQGNELWQFFFLMTGRRRYEV